MESILFSDGKSVKISTARISVGGKVLAAHNVSSVEVRRAASKSRLPGYSLAALGAFLILGGVGGGMPEAASFGMLAGIIGAFMIYLRRPRFEVLATTNAGEPVSLYKGNQNEAQPVSNMASQAMVASEPGRQSGQPVATPSWAHA